MRRYKKYIIAILILLELCISICFIPIDASRLIPVVERQVKQEFGIQAHIESLIFRFGPSLKIKAPTMHLLYEDGQKFGQLNNVKFYVPWSTIIKENVYVKRIYADKFILKINSEDKYLNSLLEKLESKDFEMFPNIKISNYNINYKLQDKNKNYTLSGNNLEIIKLLKYKNIKLYTEGQFLINERPYISYNLSIHPNFNYDMCKNSITYSDVIEYLSQIENLDFHSDIIVDVRINEDKNNHKQISGLANIDNISVLDPNNKSPKSFIYLTFWGYKVGVLSNIYSEADKKIYAEGVINNSEKPELDLKVKTDKIKLSDVYTKIKLLVDCSKYKGTNITDGYLQADFNIKGDLNKLKSTGYLKIYDAAIKTNSINVNKINSDIDFSNNIVNIANTVGYVNDSPIMLKGQIDKNLDLQLLMDKVELKHLLPDKYGIKSGTVSLNAAITGTLNKIVHKENIIIEKLLAISNDNKLSIDSLSINTNKDNVAYISNIQIEPKYTELIKIPLLKLIINQDKIVIPETNIFMPNSKVILKADISNYNNSNLLFSTNFDGFINSKDIKQFANISNIYPLKFNYYGNKDIQNIDAQVQLVKPVVLDEPSLVNLNAKVENDVFKIEDLSVLNFNGTFSNNFKSNLKGNKKLIISGNVESLTNPIFKNLRIYIPQQLSLIINKTLTQFKGDIFINGKVEKPEVIGQLSIINLVNQFMQLSMNNVTVDFNKNVAVLNAPIIKISDTVIGMNASILTDFSKEYIIKNINIKSKYLDIDSLLKYKELSQLSSNMLKILDGKLYIERAVTRLYGNELRLSALNSEFNVDKNILSLNNITSEIYNGKLAGSLQYDLINDKFNSNVQGRGISASPIFNIITNKNDSMSGAMDFDLSLSGNLVSKDSLNGKVKFIIHNGHMGVLGKLEHLLYAQNVIADNMLRTSLATVTKALTIKDTGLFKYLRGDISINNGIANIHMLQSQGPLMSLYIKGQYNTMTDYAKLTVLGRISDELSGCLGAFGEFSFNKLMLMLTGEDNKFNINAEDIEKLPQLPARNTKTFRTLINGILEKPSSVIQFNWISYDKKSLKQREIPLTNEKLPDFIESLPY